MAALAVTITAGCGIGREAAEGPPPITATPTVTSAADTVLPLDAYTLSAEEDRTVSQAYHLLVRQCGQRFGVDVQMPPPDNAGAEPSGRGFGIMDAAEAARFGYHWPPSSPLHEDDKASGGGWDPGPLERLVVLGASEDSPGTPPKDRDGRPLPEGGCAGEAERALGVRGHHVGAQFLLESTALGGLGGLVGTSLGVLVVVLVAVAHDWTAVLAPWTVIAAPLVGAVTGLLAGFYPAVSASRIEPVEALRR